MKRYLKIVALAVMMIMGGRTVAQTHGSMFIGVSFPMKDYAIFDGFNQYALTAVDESKAGAGAGFTAGFKWYYGVGVQGLGVMLSVDGFYNGPNVDLKSAYRKGECMIGDQSFIGGNFVYDETPKFINVPAMLGLNYTYSVNPHLAIYAEAGVGGNCRFITDMKTIETITDPLLGITTKQVRTREYYKSFSFAYQAGIGIEVDKNLIIGCSIYDLGSAPVNCDESSKLVIGNNSNSSEPIYTEKGTIKPIMLLGRIGFKF